MKAFDDLREAFRQAVRNFKEELNRDEVSDTADTLLREMRRELVDARAYLDRLEDDLRDAEAQAKREEASATTCRRRHQMALNIGDAETARLANRFAGKHERARDVLERKASALREEITLRRVEVADMTERLQSALRDRDGLRARAGISRARERLREDDLFEELDRIGERIDDEGRFAEAAGDVGEAVGEGEEASRRAPSEPPFRAESVRDGDELLEELKRRMERERGG